MTADGKTTYLMVKYGDEVRIYHGDARGAPAPGPVSDFPPDLKLADKGYVYFAEAKGLNLIKIGTSADPTRRWSSTDCPVPIKVLRVILGGRRGEAVWHRRFAHLRRKGEWFEGANDLRQAIEAA
jgi:hypothetical protein